MYLCIILFLDTFQIQPDTIHNVILYHFSSKTILIEAEAANPKRKNVKDKIRLKDKSGRTSYGKHIIKLLLI